MNMVIQLETEFPQSPNGFAMEFVGSVNDEAFVGRACGLWMCQSVDGIKKEDGAFHTAAILEYNPDGWDHVIQFACHVGLVNGGGPVGYVPPRRSFAKFSEWRMRHPHSSDIEWSQYDAGAKTMEICFKGTAQVRYRYHGVPADVNERIFAVSAMGESVGKFFDKFIMPTYRAEKVLATKVG